MKISYLITTHNEVSTYLRSLFYDIHIHLRPDDEVIVVDDHSTDEGTVGVLNEYVQNGFKVLKHKLNNNYSEHKNWGNQQCRGDWIFQIDGDELPNNSLLGQSLDDLISVNPDNELIWVPRLNIFKGVTPEHAARWGWRLDYSDLYKQDVVSWPDPQGRIYKNVPGRIVWHRKLHEQITGHTKFAHLPTEAFDFSDYYLLHRKTIEKQEETNLRYNRNFTESENRGI